MFVIVKLWIVNVERNKERNKEIKKIRKEIKLEGTALYQVAAGEVEAQTYSSNVAYLRTKINCN